VILVRLLQLENASSPIIVTLFGIVYSDIPAGAKATSSPLIIKHLPSLDANLPLNSFRFLHNLNADTPIVVTLSGIVILVRLQQL
jgi:hypothetical protein